MHYNSDAKISSSLNFEGQDSMENGMELRISDSVYIGDYAPDESDQTCVVQGFPSTNPGV